MDRTQKMSFYLSGYVCQACQTSQIDFSQDVTPVPPQACEGCLAGTTELKNTFNHKNIQTTIIEDLGVK